MTTKTASKLAYLAAWNQPGCLPETDPVVHETQREAWAYILDTLDTMASEIMWFDNEAGDPDRTEFAIRIEEFVEQGETGFVVGPDGYVYYVETYDPSYNDKHTYTVGEIDNLPEIETYCGNRHASGTRGAWNICFRPSHHEANHATGDGSTILAVW